MTPADIIKERVSVRDVLELHGISQPDSQGFLTCPLHQGDRVASFKVYPEGRGWYCFGCHKGGDVISLEMALDELPFREAVRKLDLDLHLGLADVSPQERRKFALEGYLAARRRKQEQAEAAREERRQHGLDLEYRRLWEIYRAGPDTGDPWDWCAAAERLMALDYFFTEGDNAGSENT